MNTQRRKQLEQLIGLVSDARSLADELASEEDEACNGIPENMQDSEKAQTMREAVEVLEVARDALEEIEGNLESIE